MAYSKVILNGTTLIDVTQKTVTASTLLQGETALKNDGTDITGEYVPSTAVLQTKSETYTPTTSQQTDSITADVGYDGLDQVDITINAVATGTAGTPTATKGTVSSHSIAVTPSVTNTTGYITGGTKTGTAVTVSASELVSGTLSITSSGTKDVTNYATANVASGSATTPATSITANPTISVSASGLITASVSGSKSVTPSVSAGYVSSGTAGTVTVSGSNTQQLTTQSAQTITPTTTDQTIASGKYLTGNQTIEGIVCTNLTAENIADGVTVKIGTATDDDSVASITGTHSGGGGGATTVSFSDEALFGADKVIYVDGTGTVQIVNGMLAMFSACSYQMQSGSTIVMFGDMAGGGAQFIDAPSTITLINSGTMTISASRGSGTLSWAVFQVN